MLKRVSIQNFKSLKDVTLDLQKVNLLIGPNNSGKTNFLKAFRFSYDSLNEDKKFLFSKYTKYNQEFNNLISIRLIFTNDIEPFKNEKFDHLIIKEDDPVFNEENFKVGIYSELTDSLGKIDNEVSHAFSQEDLIDHVGKLEIYRPDPNRIAQPASFSADEIELKGDCSNLIQFLFYLNTNYKRAYQQIEKGLAECVKDIVSFSTPPVKVGKESKLGLKFFGNNDKDYRAGDVSEGVLYFLALLCIINQPNPPKLLLLEEPEKGIHPRRIREVMDFIFRLAEEKDIQIILTTHNENVLNEFTAMPEAVFVFSKDEDGATHVKNLQKDIIEPSHQRSRETGTKEIDFTSNLGESWMYGLLGGIPEEIL